MPFTPAHAAAALPFLRLRLVPSALVIGTMAPDFEYFLRFAPGGGFGHTIPGAFLLSLPLALIVLWIFHVLLKEPLVQLLPEGVRLRIAACAVPFRFGPGRFLLIVVSALLGIATHLAWDLFTHRHTWAARRFPWLREQVSLPVLGLAAHFAILQIVSSALGLLLLGVWLWHWYSTTVPFPSDKQVSMSAWHRYAVLAGIGALAALGGSIRAAMVIASPGRDHSWVVIAGDSAATAIALAWWAAVFYAAVPARRWSRLET